MRVELENGFRITVRIRGGETHIAANKAGLLSLARQLTALTQQKPGSHIHHDEYNALEDGSQVLVIERIEG